MPTTEEIIINENLLVVSSIEKNGLRFFKRSQERGRRKRKDRRKRFLKFAMRRRVDDASLVIRESGERFRKIMF